MPVYEVGPYVSDAIRSVIGQTWANWQLICVDDGSTDGSYDTCLRLASQDPRITVVRQEHAGLSAARNRGISLARGEYLYLLDSDDMMEPRTLERCVEVAASCDADIVQFEARVLVQDGADHDSNQYIRSRSYPGVWSGPELYVAQRRAGDYYAQSCMYLSRVSIFGDMDEPFPLGVIHEDQYGTFAALMGSKRVVCLREQLYVRRYRPGSIMSSRDWRASTRGYFRVYAEVLARDFGAADSAVVAEARELCLEEQRERIIDCFSRTGASPDDFVSVVGARLGVKADEEALARLLSCDELRLHRTASRGMVARVRARLSLAVRRVRLWVEGLART